MAIRFTSRLVAFPTPSGKLLLSYRYLGSGGRIWTITGPEMVQPPGFEMTAEELSRWIAVNYRPPSYSWSGGRTPVSAALVEAKYTIEDEIPKGSVSARLLWVDWEDGERAFAVELVNGWPKFIPGVALSAGYQYEAGQPIPGATVPAKMLGGESFDFTRSPSDNSGILYPNHRALFVLSPTGLAELLSRAASLSSENHWIGLHTEGHEFDRVPGAVVAVFLEQD